MKKLELIKIEHNTKIGDKCEQFTPNITEDCLLYEKGELLGFYIKDISKHSNKLSDYIAIANKEFRSKNVPKSMLNRMSAIRQQSAQKEIQEKFKEFKGEEVKQMSCILGSIPPKPVVRRPYPTISSVHKHPKAKTFIKAMLLACKESENLIQKLTPEIYDRKFKLIEENVPKKYRFGKLFTSSISNYNISAPFHRDTGNIVGAVNVIIAKKQHAIGGNLNVPDYNATFDSCDNSMIVYPAWKSIHGVTPIEPKTNEGYRNSLVFYPLKAFKKYI